MLLPVRLLRDRWPGWIERRLARFVWSDPSVITRPDVSPERFREAMSAIHVGGTIKITTADRHPEPDALLLDNLDTANLVIADVGASDGSTSLDLVRKLDGFAGFVISDLFLEITSARVGRRTVFYDPAGQAILMCGHRFIAWPVLSRLVRILVAPVLLRAATTAREPVTLLNPDVVELLAQDPRVATREHDVFTVWPDPKPDVIKVANLLRRLYFTDEQIARALRALHASLPEGGHLLVVDNSREPGMPPRGGLYRREPSGFSLVAETTNTPEIGGLVTALEVAEDAGHAPR